MSNRQQRRTRHYIPSDGITNIIESTGMKVEIVGDQVTKLYERDPLAGTKPDEHVWALFAMFKVDVNTVFSQQAHLDTENLITISGPGCYRCEQVYSKEVASKPCPGEPSGY